MEAIIAIIEKLPKTTVSPFLVGDVNFQQRAEYEKTCITFSSKLPDEKPSQQQARPRSFPGRERDRGRTGNIPQIFYRRTFIGALLPLIDDMCLMYTDAMLNDYENDFKQMLFKHLKQKQLRNTPLEKSGAIMSYIGRVKSKRLVAYIEDPQSRQNKELGLPLDIMKTLVEFLFDKPCVISESGSYDKNIINITIINPNRFGLVIS